MLLSTKNRPFMTGFCEILICYAVKLFKELVANYGMTIIMTTHDPSMVDVADRVYTLEDGEIVE